MTRVIVEPYVDESIKSTSMVSIIKEWISTFHVADLDELCSQKCGFKCTSLTKAELECTNHLNKNNYLISIEALESPIQAQIQKETGLSPMKKFLNSIYMSYKSEYLEVKISQTKIWAELIASEITTQKHRLKISRFLRQQINLFDINHKVLVKAVLIDDELEKKIFSMGSKRFITLKTNSTKNVSIEFISFNFSLTI